MQLATVYRLRHKEYVMDALGTLGALVERTQKSTHIALPATADSSRQTETS
jgi:hypothetical protein